MACATTFKGACVRFRQAFERITVGIGYQFGEMRRIIRGRIGVAVFRAPVGVRGTQAERQKSCACDSSNSRASEVSIDTALTPKGQRDMT